MAKMTRIKTNIGTARVASVKEKHILAACIFNDVNRIEVYDAKHSDTEARYYTIGRVGDVLFVVYTDRGEVFRLISARFATKREEEVYYGNC